MKTQMEYPTAEQINEAIETISKQSTAPDKDTPDWMKRDIRNGIEWALRYLKQHNIQQPPYVKEC